MNKRKAALAGVGIILFILALLYLVPIGTKKIGACDNVPSPKRLSLLRGDSIAEGFQKMGGDNACPSVDLRLYVL